MSYSTLLLTVSIVLLVGALLLRSLIWGAGSQARTMLMFLLSIVFACVVFVSVAWVMARCNITPPQTIEEYAAACLGAVVLAALSLWFLFGKTSR